MFDWEDLYTQILSKWFGNVHKHICGSDVQAKCFSGTKEEGFSFRTAEMQIIHALSQIKSQI